MSSSTNPFSDQAAAAGYTAAPPLAAWADDSQVNNAAGRVANGQAALINKNKEQLKKIAKIAAVVFGVSIAAITVAAVLTNYPTANTAFFTLFGITATLSLVGLAVTGVRYYKKPEIKDA